MTRPAGSGPPPRSNKHSPENRALRQNLWVNRRVAGRPQGDTLPVGQGPGAPGVNRIVARLGPARPSGTRPPSAGLAGPLPAPHPAEEHQRCPQKSPRRDPVTAGLSSDDGWKPRCGRPR
jgi:hypothetical protein